MNMTMDFSEAKLKQLDAATTFRVYGHELEFERETAKAGVRAGRRYRLFQPCLCVQDSPQNPCPCDDTSFWWLLEDAIIGGGNAGRRDHHGQELQFFDVLIDSKIMVETVRPVSAGVLKGLGQNISPETILLAGLLSDAGGLGVIQSIKLTPEQKEKLLKALKWFVNVLLTFFVEDLFATLPGGPFGPFTPPK